MPYIVISCQINHVQECGNDTIDCYPPAFEKVEKILCVSEKVFKRVQRDFKGFLKGHKVLRPKSIKAKAKPIKKAVIAPKPSSFEPSNCIGNLDNTYRHRVGRLNDWYSTYGQGMYE